MLFDIDGTLTHSDGLHFAVCAPAARAPPHSPPRSQPDSPKRCVALRRPALSRCAAHNLRRSFREYLKEERFQNGEPIDEDFFKARISGR